MRKQRLVIGLAAALAFFGSAAVQAQEASEPVDVLEKSKARGKLIACADPYGFPYAARNQNPPGFDVEILQALAKRGGMELEMYWADTGTRGGMSRALRNSMMKGRCDIFAGVSDSGDDDILMGKLAFTDPYLGMGYILVVQNKAANMKTIEEISAAGMKIGVQMSTPIDAYLHDNEIPRELYPDNPRVMRGMARGEIDAALVWATVLTNAQRKYPDATFKMAEGYVPVENQQWDLNYLVRKRDKSMMQFINEGIQELLDNGKIKEIVESYGVPFYPPFSS
ncbi:MAG: transporter substrate-binding domain-containing protein [Betaproteobacteria bacterium]|nr:MAG: transporter substrate-binding domain-containing protein [Betaproteobacteria bacterium]